MFSSGTSSGVFVIALLIYIVIMAVIGYITTRKESSGENFVTGGRGVGIILMVGTIGATTIGTGSSIGSTANGYLYGWAGSLLATGLSLGLLGMLIFKGVRKFKFLTMAEELQFYYGGSEKIRKIVGVMLFIVEIIWVANHINGGSKYLCYVTGMDPFPAKLIIVFGFLAFTYFGGYLSVIVTDTIQFVIIIFGFIAVAIGGLIMSGGYQGITEAYTAAGNAGALSFYGLESYGVMTGITLLVSSFFSVIAVPAFHTRLFTARTDKVASRSYWGNAIILFVFAFFPSLIGMSAFAIASSQGIVLESADFAFHFMALKVLPLALGVFFLIAGLSATMSSADSDLISGVTILLEDVYPSITGRNVTEKDYKKVSQMSMLLATFLAFLLSLYAGDIIAFTMNVVGSVLPGIGICTLAGRVWKRCTWQGGMACIIGSFAFALCYLLIAPLKAVIISVFGGPAIVAAAWAILLVVVGSLCSKKCQLSDEEKLALVMKTREHFAQAQ